MISMHRHRTPDDGPYDEDEFLKIPALLARAEDNDVEVIRVRDLSTQGLEIVNEVGRFSLKSTDISARVHQLPTSIASSSIEESGPFDLVSIRPASRTPAAGGAGPVAGGAVTPRIKLPKKKEPPTADAVQQSERKRVIEAEKLFLRSPGAKSWFGETQRGGFLLPTV
jgi:hypothetical protein